MSETEWVWPMRRITLRGGGPSAGSGFFCCSAPSTPDILFSTEQKLGYFWAVPRRRNASAERVYRRTFLRRQRTTELGLRARNGWRRPNGSDGQGITSIRRRRFAFCHHDTGALRCTAVTLVTRGMQAVLVIGIHRC